MNTSFMAREIGGEGSPSNSAKDLSQRKRNAHQKHRGVCRAIDPKCLWPIKTKCPSKDSGFSELFNKVSLTNRFEIPIKRQRGWGCKVLQQRIFGNRNQIRIKRQGVLRSNSAKSLSQSKPNSHQKTKSFAE